jgi:hypothetical protein
MKKSGLKFPVKKPKATANGAEPFKFGSSDALSKQEIVNRKLGKKHIFYILFKC